MRSGSRPCQTSNDYPRGGPSELLNQNSWEFWSLQLQSRLVRANEGASYGLRKHFQLKRPADENIRSNFISIFPQVEVLGLVGRDLTDGTEITGGV